jgi:gliding motility-associated-like protein
MKIFSIALALFLFFFTSKEVLAQCAGTQSSTVTPAPNGTCVPGTVYTVCYTMVGYSEAGANWIDGFELNLTGPWVASSITGTSAPANCNGGGGNWMWANTVVGSSTGQTNGPGYFFDRTVDGNPGNDFGDNGSSCTWSFCFDLTVGNSPGASLSVGITALGDGEIGSWSSTACQGSVYSIFDCIIDVPCGTLNVVVDQNESCPGNANGQASATMTGGTTPIGYSWNTAPAQTTSVATGLTSGNYIVTATDAAGCVVSNNVTITTGTSSDATINNINATNTLCAGDGAVQITTVQASGVFSGSGVNASGMFTPANANLGANVVIYSIGGNCPDTEVITIDIVEDADATIDPVAQLCTANTPIQLTSASSGGTWSGIGVNTTGLFDPAAAGIGTHTITHTVPDPCGDVKTIDILVGNLTANTNATPSICTADNGTATLSPIIGSAPYTYSWSSVPVQTTSTAIDLAPGNYDITVLDADGCSLSTTVTVPFDPSDLTVSISASTNALCNGSCDGNATALELGGTAPYQFVWDDPNVQQTPQATSLCANTHNVFVADANGCLATAQVVITEPTAISPTAVMDNQSNCGNPDGQVSATANGGSAAVDYSYSWNSTPAQNTAVATNLVPAIYTVTVTDDNGCSETADVNITSTPGFTATISSFTDESCFQSCDGTATALASNAAVAPLSYSWNSTPTQNTATAANLCAGTYDLTITDDLNCVATASIIIGEPTMVSTSVAASASPICIGESSNLISTISGGTQPYTTTVWTSTPNDPSLITTQQNPTVSPIITTDYSLIATDANGCVSIPKIVTVEVLDPLTLAVTSPLSMDTGICPYDFATIDLLATGGDGAYSYFLEPNPAPITLPMQVQPSSTTTYDFIVTDGCTTPAVLVSSTITVFILPEVDFVGDDLEGCDPHVTNFTDLTQPTPVSWEWSFSDSNSGVINSSIADPFHAYSGTGIYDVSLAVESADGCVSDNTKTEYIEVFPLPSANFQANPEQTNVLDGEISFTDLSIDSIAAWSWDFGTGDLSSEQNPAYTYRDTGTFLVWLQVVTIHDCEDQTSRQIEIEPDFMFYVPNAFTPNSDGRNDSFRGYGEGVNWDTYQMSVFNRWGEEIFFTNSIDNPWDGSFNGKSVPNETYVWNINIDDMAGNRHTYRGHVTVVQ